MRWVAACAVAAGLGTGIVTGSGVAVADTDGIVSSDPGSTEARNIAAKAQWNRAIQQIDRHNVGISASTTTKTVQTPKTQIKLTVVTMKGNV
jgi:hypothetical protein